MVPRRLSTRVLAAAAVAVALGALAACAPDEGPVTAPSEAGGTPSASPTTSAPAPAPTTTAGAAAEIPEDCRAMLPASVLAQLADVPLNDPATGVPTGAQPDGSLVCLWRDPAADTTSLQTTISRTTSGPALDMLNELVANEGYTCFTPDGGTRCEKTWPNEMYPVTDGRTLFYRDGVLIDTQYSNLAPTGYTSAIISHIFPAA